MRATIRLLYKYVLTIIAPDEAEHPDYEKPIWQVLVEGTPDSELAVSGFVFGEESDGKNLSHTIRQRLYHFVSSSVIDSQWHKVEPLLVGIHQAYQQQTLPGKLVDIVNRPTKPT